MNEKKGNGKVDKFKKVEEPSTYNDREKRVRQNITEQSLFEKVIQKGKQDIKEGKGISHEEMLVKIKLKYPFLK